MIRSWQSLFTISERIQVLEADTSILSILIQKLQRSSVGECTFDYTALHIECKFNKNSLLLCCFLCFLVAEKRFKTLNHKIA